MQSSIEIEVIRRPRPMVSHRAGTEATSTKHKKPPKETQQHSHGCLIDQSLLLSFKLTTKKKPTLAI